MPHHVIIDHGSLMAPKMTFAFAVVFALVLVAAADQVFELPDGTSAAVAASGAIQYHGHRHPYENAPPPPPPFAEGFSSARLPVEVLRNT